MAPRHGRRRRANAASAHATARVVAGLRYGCVYVTLQAERQSTGCPVNHAAVCRRVPASSQFVKIEQIDTLKVEDGRWGTAALESKGNARRAPPSGCSDAKASVLDHLEVPAGEPNTFEYLVRVANTTFHLFHMDLGCVHRGGLLARQTTQQSRRIVLVEGSVAAKARQDADRRRRPGRPTVASDP